MSALQALAGHRAPGWLHGGSAGRGAVGGNLQTIVSARLSRADGLAPPRWQRQRWNTPDGDFIDVDFLDTPTGPSTATVLAGPAAAPLPSRLVLFHGLEGNSSSHYSRAFAAIAAERGWSFAIPHFRGCSGEINRAPRAYHSGDHEEIGWILERLARHWDRSPDAPVAPGAVWGAMHAVGISLGGNALLRWAEEAGAQARARVASLAALSSPIDLAAGGRAIAEGFNRWVYTRMFLASMKPKAMLKWQQHPGLFDRQRLQAARTLYEFDDVFTAPLHGFRDTEDYWARASAKPQLGRIRVPSLVLNALNDPFVPAASLPPASRLEGGWVQVVQPVHGGHLGFASGRPPGDMRPFVRRVADWLAEPDESGPGPAPATAAQALHG